MILSGELQAGERLNEQALATRLGVSRGPIREATRALERAGLLTAIVNQGVFVRQLSRDEASEIYDVRGVVFGFACAAARAAASRRRRRRALHGFVEPHGRGDRARRQRALLPAQPRLPRRHHGLRGAWARAADLRVADQGNASVPAKRARQAGAHARDQRRACRASSPRSRRATAKKRAGSREAHTLGGKPPLVRHHDQRKPRKPSTTNACRQRTRTTGQPAKTDNGGKRHEVCHANGVVRDASGRHCLLRRHRRASRRTSSPPRRSRS